MKTFWLVRRFINGISINGYEYMLDGEGNLMKFNSEQAAKDFLISYGFNLDYVEIVEETMEEK